MKKICIFLLCLALLPALAGCGKPSPSTEALELGDITLVDNNVCRITAVRFLTSSSEGRLALVLENKLPDRGCVFSFFGLSVNSVPSQNDAVRFQLAPGERSVKYIPFIDAARSLEGGATPIADMELRFLVQDALNEAWEYVPYTVFHICPNTESAEPEESPSA